MSKKLYQIALITVTGLTITGISLTSWAQGTKGKQVKPITKKVPGGTISFGQPSKPKDPTKTWAFLPAVVASVGDQKITKEEFIKELKTQFPMQYNNLDQANAKRFAKEMATGMTDKILLLDLAKKDKIIPSADLVKKGLDEIMKNLSPQEKQFFMKNLEMKKTSFEAFKDKRSKEKKTQEAFAINKWIKKNIEPKLKITDAEIKKFYDDNKKAFQKPETIQASHILIKTEGSKPEDKAKAKKKAQDILARLKKGEDFAELAKKESACPSKNQGGSLGEFPRGRMVPAFEKAAFALKPGELSGVVETNFGYHIIKTTKKSGQEVTPFNDKVKEYIKKRLKAQKEVQELDKFLNAERTKYGVKVNI